MKIQQTKLDKFIQEIGHSGVISCLLYGHDYGIKSITSDNIIASILKSEPDRILITLNSDVIENDPNILYEECFNIGLLGDKKIIKIRDVGNGFFQIIETIVQNIGSNDDILLILICDHNVDTNSKLVSLHERLDKLAAIGCYSDDASTSMTIIKKFFNDNVIHYHNDAVNAIASNVRGDRMVLLSELEKLLLYMGDTKNLTMDAVEESMNDLSEMSLDSLVDAIASRKYTTAIIEFKRAMKEDFSIIGVTRILSSHFIKLRTALYNIKEGSAIQDEARKAKIFFKRLGAFQEQIKSWTIKDVESMITTLFNLELDLKRYPENVGKLIMLNAIIAC